MECAEGVSAGGPRGAGSREKKFRNFLADLETGDGVVAFLHIGCIFGVPAGTLRYRVHGSGGDRRPIRKKTVDKTDKILKNNYPTRAADVKVPPPRAEISAIRRSPSFRLERKLIAAGAARPGPGRV